MGRKKNPASDMDVSGKLSMPLAQRLNELITDTNALKDHLGVSAQAVNQYRLGLARPSLENLCKIADFYNTSTDYLLGLSNTPSVKEDIQQACKTTGLSTAVVDWLKSIIDDPVRLKTLNAILENKTFQSMLSFVNELENVQIAAEMDRWSGNDDVTPAKEIGYGKYVVGGYEYLSVLEYRISELFRIVVDDVTRLSLDDLGG